ncbi:MAG: TonB-dependent receptor [Pseudomonadota bacterium]
MSPCNNGSQGAFHLLLLAGLATGALVPAPAWADPTLHEASPDQGSSAGGTALVLTGTGFEPGAEVLVCGRAAGDVAVQPDGTLAATTPAGEPGLCDIAVRDPDGSIATLTAAFRYVTTPAEPTPDAAEYRGDDTVVTGTRVPRKLADTPVLTELIPAEVIEARGAVCLLDALSNEPGVRVDNVCSVCNTTGVKLAGMPGRYTALLIDGVPVYSSLGQTYGWLMVSAADVARIEVVKGANSILYGTDAMGGVINVITRRPEEQARARMTSEYGAFGYHYLTGTASARRGDTGVSVVASHTSHDSVDRDGDQISEYTGYDRANMASTFTWERGRVSTLTRLSVTQEKRQGGGLGSFVEVLDDDEARRAVSESILSRRQEGSSVIDVDLGPKLDLETTIAAVHHVQDSDYEGEVYVGDQVMLFAQEALEAQPWERYSLVAGATYRGEFLDENLAISEYAYHMGGAFVQGDWMPSLMAELLHGVRFDYHNVFGPVFTPRVSLRVTPLPPLTLRLTGGTGFRTPTTFYEYAHGVRPEGYELLMDADEPERSLNGALSASLDTGRVFRATASAAFNRVMDPITVDTTEDGNLLVHNVDGYLDVIAAEVQVQSAPVDWLRLAAGYGHYIYDDQGGALVSAAPADTIDFAVDLVTGAGFMGSVALEVYGPMDLRGVYGPAFHGGGQMDVARWLDPASADTSGYKLERSPWWATLDARAEQRLGDGVSLYAGGKNLTDFHQCDVESPLMFPEEDDGSAGPMDVVYIWGPLRGRFLYAGLKVEI